LFFDAFQNRINLTLIFTVSVNISDHQISQTKHLLSLLFLVRALLGAPPLHFLCEYFSTNFWTQIFIVGTLNSDPEPDCHHHCNK